MHKETIIGIAIELIVNGVGVGLQMTGITYPIVGWIIIGVSTIAGIILIRYGIRKKGKGDKPAIGLLVGRNNGKIINCHASGKITIHGKPEDVDAGGLIGTAGESSEVEGSSADAEIEYKQD